MERTSTIHLLVLTSLYQVLFALIFFSFLQKVILFSMLSKVWRKILVSFSLVQNGEILDLPMARIEKSILQLPSYLYEESLSLQ
jgi:hypothetical protein